MSNSKETGFVREDQGHTSKIAPFHATAATAPVERGGDSLHAIIEEINSGRCEQALVMLDAAPASNETANLRGVCLLRLGRTTQATELFRALVERLPDREKRPESFDVYYVNLATAVLMGGSVMACRFALSQCKNANHPTAERLRTCMETWEKNLSWWQRFNWRLGAVEPTDGPIAVDFEPGEFAALQPDSNSVRMGRQ